MAHAETGAQHGHHVIPKKLLFKVFGALVGLTILTVITAKFVDIGPLNIPLALTIAGVKATLVVMFFMALKYDNRVNTLAFIVGSIFVVVFLVFTLFDTAFRGDVGNVGAETISDQELREEGLRKRQEALNNAGAAPAAVPAPSGEADAAEEAPAAEGEAAPAEENAPAPGEGSEGAANQ